MIPTTDQKAVAVGTTPGHTGRPLVPLNLNGITAIGFLDTSSETTIIKPRTFQLIDPHGTMCHKDPVRDLKGVADKTLDTIGEVILSYCLASILEIPHQVAVCDAKFPGDVLIMDFLHRRSFNLSSSAEEDRACLAIEGQPFPVTYTDTPTIQISVVSAEATSLTNPMNSRCSTAPPSTQSVDISGAAVRF